LKPAKTQHVRTGAHSGYALAQSQAVTGDYLVLRHYG